MATSAALPLKWPFVVWEAASLGSRSFPPNVALHKEKIFSTIFTVGMKKKEIVFSHPLCDYEHVHGDEYARCLS